jgi:CHAP domain-containing protein
MRPKTSFPATLVLLLSLLGVSVLQAGAQPAIEERPLRASHPQQITFSLDAVTLELREAFLPGSKIYTSAPGDLNQVASAATWRPFREISITAVPFGSKPGTEDLPVAEPGGASAYKSELANYRRAQGAEPRPGPVAKILGQDVEGLASVVRLNVDGPTRKRVLIVEWVAEAGERIWIVRASQEQPPIDRTQKAYVSALISIEGLALTSNNTLDSPSTVGEAIPDLVTDTSAASSALSAVEKADLPAPSWWNGSDCDYNHYRAVSGTGSYRLGGVYRGMPACGPRPLAGGTDVSVTFSSTSVTQLEWECTELSKRYLFLAYGIPAYQGNGSQVVWNYSGSLLRKISNGTVNSAPQAGDVLSYGATSTAGHTSVVTSSSVPSTGTCTDCIAVIEQNNSSTGSRTLSMNNWSVVSSLGVTGWLHYPTAAAPVPSQMTSPTPGSTLPGSSVTFQWSSGSGVSQYYLYVGNSQGANDIYGASQGTNRSVTLNLPTDGRRLYVRLWSLINSAWSYYDYQYTAARLSTATPAQMTNPTPGITLSGSLVTFQWSAGSGVSQYFLYVGSSLGANDLYGASQGTNRSVTVRLPTDGRKLYVRLWSLLTTGWAYRDYTYYAYH